MAKSVPSYVRHRTRSGDRHGEVNVEAAVVSAHNHLRRSLARYRDGTDTTEMQLGKPPVHADETTSTPAVSPAEHASHFGCLSNHENRIPRNSTLHLLLGHSYYFGEGRPAHRIAQISRRTCTYSDRARAK